jgi:hypothetical protein
MPVPAIRRIPAIVMLVLATIVISLPARAEMTFRQYQHLFSTKQYDVMNLYVGGLFTAMSAIVISYEGDKPEKFFCVPNEISFVEMHDTIAMEVAARPDLYVQNPNIPMTQVAFDAARRRYPCKQ